MDKVRTAHAASRQFAIEALGNDAGAVTIVDWTTVAFLTCLGGFLLVRTCGQGIGLLSDASELGVAVIALLTKLSETVERTWRRMATAMICALLAFISLRAAVGLYVEMADDRSPSELVDTARANAEAMVEVARAVTTSNTSDAKGMLDTAWSWIR